MRRLRANASMTARYQQVAAILAEDYREGGIDAYVFDYWMHRLEHANSIEEIDEVENEYYGGRRYVRNGTLRVGAKVAERGRIGKVVAHRPKGMVDVRFEDGFGIERRPASGLRLNPAAQKKKRTTRRRTSARTTRRAAAASAPATRTARAPRAEAQVLDVTREQFNAVVQGVYESLVKKKLGRKNFKWQGERIDEKALAAGTLTREDIDAMVGSAFAIATRQGQRHGHLQRGTQRATAAGAALSIARLQDREHAEENRRDYERTLELRRKPRANGRKRR